MARRTQQAATASMATVGYVRVSTQEQAAHGVSLNAQEARIRAYCTMRGLDLVEVIVDAGVSAGKYTLDERDGGARVLAAVTGGEVCHVVALKLDRLFRDAEDALHQTKAWDKAGIALHLIDLGGASIDTSSAMGRMFLTMMAGMAEWEKNVIAERTKAALARKSEKGERVGTIPYGYSLAADGRRLDEEATEQHVLRRMRALRAEGLSLRAIGTRLAAMGMLTRGGQPWAPQTLARILDRDIA